MKKLNTVNVLESLDGTPNGINSFPDTKEGNKKAEQLFTDIIEKNQGTRDMNYIGEYLEEGVYEDDNGYGAYLIHSN